MSSGHEHDGCPIAFGVLQKSWFAKTEGPPSVQNAQFLLTGPDGISWHMHAELVSFSSAGEELTSQDGISPILAYVTNRPSGYRSLTSCAEQDFDTCTLRHRWQEVEVSGTGQRLAGSGG